MNYKDIMAQAQRMTPHIGKWWAGKSRLSQAGYVGAGAFLGALGVSRTIGALGSRRGILRPLPPPDRHREVYRRAPGLQNYDRRIGHHRMGQARSEDHLRNLYGGG